MVAYLGHIELKANQLLQQYAQLRQALLEASAKASGLTDGPNAGDAAMSKTLVTVMGAGPRIAMGENLMHSMTINLPKGDEFFHSDDSDDDDAYDNDELRPLTRDELKLRTLNKLNKRSGGSSGGGSSGTLGGGPSDPIKKNGQGKKK
jgi:hypothetical protein